MGFKPASKEASYLRFAIAGPSGSGKTKTALRIGARLARWRGTRLAAIDTERGSMSKYVRTPKTPDGFDFDVEDKLPSFKPEEYIKAINVAVREGYRVLIIDSVSHAWEGIGGILDQADRKGNRHDAWKDLTPQHRQLVEAMLTAPLDLIVTMRTKTAWEYEKNDRGKIVPIKIGLAPVQRAGMEYEFDVFMDIDHDHYGRCSKTRCSALDGADFKLPGEDVADILIDWLGDGEPVSRTPMAEVPDPPREPQRKQPTARTGVVVTDYSRREQALDEQRRAEPATEVSVEAASKTDAGAALRDKVARARSSAIDWFAERDVRELVASLLTTL